jgi:hypothetical protein
LGSLRTSGVGEEEKQEKEDGVSYAYRSFVVHTDLPAL